MKMPLCEPVIVIIRAGVLAKTPDDHMFRIGVVGRDETEARERFSEALIRWREWARLTEERLTANSVTA